MLSATWVSGLTLSYRWSQHVAKIATSTVASTGYNDSVRYADVRAGRKVTTQLVLALVISKLDYCNSIFAGLLTSTLNVLQKVRNKQYDSSVSWDLEITSVGLGLVLCNSNTGYPHGRVCCTNSAYLCTKSTVVKLRNTSVTETWSGLQSGNNTNRMCRSLPTFGLSLENEPFRKLDQQRGTDFHMTFVCRSL